MEIPEISMKWYWQRTLNEKLFLSNSQIDTYTSCNRKWFLDKQMRLRPNWKGSALLFGGSLDAAVEHILLKKKDQLKMYS